MSLTRPLHKRIRDHFFYGLVRVLLFILRLPPRRIAIAAMRLMARLLFLVLRRERSKTIEHLTLAYGKEKSAAEIEQLARRVFLHFITAFVDLVRMDDFVSRSFVGMVSCTGFEHLERAAEGKKGVIALTAHFGNWELLGAYVVHRGIPLKVVGTALQDPRIDALLVSTRNRAGYTNIARGKDTKEILRVLRNGEALGMLIDQDTKVAGVFVDFFGIPAHTPTGPAVLARKYDVPIVPIFMWLKEDLTYQLECFPPLNLIRTDDAAHDLEFNTRKCSEVYERIIRQHPEQWAWMHKRWKTRPEGEAECRTAGAEKKSIEGKPISLNI